MNILEYDQVDPMSVFHLNDLSLGYSLTPERVSVIRRLDARPFSFFALYAVDGSRVVGQVGVYRLTLMSKQGPQDVGGVCAMCTDPEFRRQGIASRLLEEAHARMRTAGLRFSTLGTSRHLGAHTLYQRHGYVDLHHSASNIRTWKSPPSQDTIRAERAGISRLPQADQLFHDTSAGRLGFAHRQESFLSMLVETGELRSEDVWLLFKGDDVAGYAIASSSRWRLLVSNLLLRDNADVDGALAALASANDARYVRVRIDDRTYLSSTKLEVQDTHRSQWGTLMVKLLDNGVSIEDFKEQFGVGTDRFLISWMDIT